MTSMISVNNHVFFRERLLCCDVAPPALRQSVWVVRLVGKGRSRNVAWSSELKCPLFLSVDPCHTSSLDLHEQAT